ALRGRSSIAHAYARDTGHAPAAIRTRSFRETAKSATKTAPGTAASSGCSMSTAMLRNSMSIAGPNLSLLKPRVQGIAQELRLSRLILRECAHGASFLGRPNSQLRFENAESALKQIEVNDEQWDRRVNEKIRHAVHG